jgi:hypothetical protein
VVAASAASRWNQPESEGPDARAARAPPIWIAAAGDPASAARSARRSGRPARPPAASSRTSAARERALPWRSAERTVEALKGASF